jgi:transposase InsO family protein
VLARHGVCRRRRTERPHSSRRYEWAEAGALLHIDAFELAKFDRPGHWAMGRGEQHKTRNAGKIKIVGVIDDHTRLAYCEIHAAENAKAVSITLRRAARWFSEQGCGPVQAVMSDNALCYTRSHEFRDALTELGARHIRIPAYTPRWNGKIERFFQTLDTEWAHSRIWPTSASATARCHRSCATTTTDARTPPPAAEHPSPAFSTSASSTARASRGCGRTRASRRAARPSSRR